MARRRRARRRGEGGERNTRNAKPVYALVYERHIFDWVLAGVVMCNGFVIPSQRSRGKRKIRALINSCPEGSVGAGAAVTARCGGVRGVPAIADVDSRVEMPSI